MVMAMSIRLWDDDINNMAARTRVVVVAWW